MSRMSAAEFAAYRHMMGHTLNSLSRALDVNPRTVRSWESGRDLIPDRIADEMIEFTQRHYELAQEMADDEQVVTIPRQPDGDFPRGWYVAAVTRAIQIEPDLRVEWSSTLSEDD